MLNDGEYFVQYIPKESYPWRICRYVSNGKYGFGAYVAMFKTKFFALRKLRQITLNGYPNEVIVFRHNTFMRDVLNDK